MAVNAKRTNRKPQQKRGLLFLAAIFTFSTVLTSFAPQTAQAFTSEQNMQYYSLIFLRDCMNQLDENARIAQQYIDSNTFLSPNKSNVGVYIGRVFKPDNGHAMCNDPTLTQKALQSLGYSNGRDFLRDAVYNIEEEIDKWEMVNGREQKTGTQLAYRATSKRTSQNAINAIFAKKGIDQGPEGKYVALRSIFQSYCSIVEPPTNSGGSIVTYNKLVQNSEGVYESQSVRAEFTIEDRGSYIDSNGNSQKLLFDTANRSIENYNYDGDSAGRNTTCQALLDEVSKLTSAAARYNNSEEGKKNPIPTTSEATSEAGCSVNPSAEGCIDNRPTFGSELAGVGWFVCPAMTAGAGFADFIWGAFEALLRINPLRESGGKDDGAYYATWKNIRNIANVLFILAFVLVVFSQVSNIGISNYGVKKMLPRMIIAAIAINLSFFIVQIAVDVANIAGGVILDTLTSTIDVTARPNWMGIIDVILGITAAGGAIYLSAVALGAIGWPLLVLLAILLIPAIVGILAAFLTLIVRSALIPIIAIFAPLAFVAYIFPNGQSLFDKWRKTFTALLLLYPLAAIYYGALKFVAFIIIGTSTNPFEMIMGHSLLFMGSAAVLFLAVKSNAITGKMFGAVQNGINKVAKPVQKAGMGLVGGMAAMQWARLKTDPASAVKPGSGLLGSRSVTRGIGGAARWFDTKKRNRDLDTQILKGEQSRQWREALALSPSDIPSMEDTITGRAEADKLREEAIGNATKSLQGHTTAELVLSLRTGQDRGGHPMTEATRIAARDMIMANGGFNDRRAVLENIASDPGLGRDIKSRLVKAAYAKGDGNIYGVNFGDDIVSGNINNAAGLAQSAVANADNLQAEHMVQSSGATRWLSGEISASNNQNAHNSFIRAAESAQAPGSETAAKISADLENTFRAAGVPPPLQPQPALPSPTPAAPVAPSPSQNNNPTPVPGGAAFTQQTASGLRVTGNTGQTPPNNQPPPPPNPTT